jgi:hypothetical protein
MTLHSDDESTAKSSSFSRLPPRFPGCRDQDCSESKICKKWLIFVKMQHGRSRPKNFGSLKVAVILLKGIGKFPYYLFCALAFAGTPFLPTFVLFPA